MSTSKRLRQLFQQVNRRRASKSPKVEYDSLDPARPMIRVRSYHKQGQA